MLITIEGRLAPHGPRVGAGLGRAAPSSTAFAEQSGAALGDVAVAKPATVAFGMTPAIAELLDEFARCTEPLSAEAWRALEELRSMRTDADACAVSVDELIELRNAVDRLCASTATADRVGVGLVDTSPAERRTGLLRAWTGSSARPRLACSRGATVGVVGGAVQVQFADARRPAVEISECQVGIDGALVRDSDGGEHLLPAAETEALCELVPESTRWKVLRIPEVLAWAPLRTALHVAVEDSVLIETYDAVIEH